MTEHHTRANPPAEPKRASKATDKLLEAGNALVSGSLGVAAGITAGPFAGTAVAVAAHTGIEAVAADYLRRRLSPDEQTRIGGAVLFGAARIRQRIEAGEKPRLDGFFENRGLHRSSAEELLDGVLRTAQDAWEEKRIRHLGYFYASIPFRTDITAADASYLLDTAARLTYRQLTCLALLGGTRGELPDWEGDRLKADAAPELFHEISHLGRNGLIRRNYGETISAPDQFNPAATVHSPLGERLYETLELYLMADDELVAVREQLKRLADVRWAVGSSR